MYAHRNWTILPVCAAVRCTKGWNGGGAGELHDRLEAAHPALLEELMRLQLREIA